MQVFLVRLELLLKVTLLHGSPGWTASGRLVWGEPSIVGAPAMPFKANRDRQHHIPKQRHQVTNWAVGGQEAVLDVGEHGVRPAEGGVTRGGATGAGDVALVGNTRLVSYATKPLPAVADDSGSGLDGGA